MPEEIRDLSPDFARSWATIFAKSDELVFAIDARRRILAVSEGFACRFGASAGDVLGHTCAEVAHEDGSIPGHCPFHELLLDGRQHQAEVHSELLGGDFLVRVTPVLDERGELECALHSLLETTDRHRAEDALRQSESRYRGYFEQTLVGVVVASPDRRLVEVNQAACDLLGYDRDELLRLTWTDLTHPDDLTADRARNQSLLAGETGSTRFEKRFIRKDGEVVNADMSLSCQRRPDGSVDSFVALISDVTEQRRSAQESALLKHSIDVHRDGAFWMGTDNTFVYVNEATCAMLGYSRSELIGQHLSLVSPEATSERLVRIWERLRTEGSFTAEAVHRRKDGSELPVQITSSYVSFGGCEYNCGFARDITERRRTENALLMFKTAADEATYGVAMAGRDGLFTYVNAAAAAMHGWAPEELLGRPVSLFHNEEQSGRFRELFGRVLNEGGFSSEEAWHVRRDGSVFPALMSATRIGGIAGQPGFSAVTMVDITERVHTEQELRRAEERYARAQAIGHLGHWEYDPKAREFRGSDEVVRLCGLDPAATGHTVDEVTGRISEREAVRRAFVDLLEHDAPFDMELEIDPADGAAVRIVWVRAEVERDGDGSPVRVTGILQDTTADRRADEALRESQMMRDVAEHVARVGSLKWARSGARSAWSPEVYEIFDIHPGEFDGDLLRALKARVHPEDLEHLMRGVTGVMELGVLPVEEFRIVRRDGEERSIQCAGTGERDADGVVTALIGYVQDVTERRRAEAEIQQLNAELEERVEARTVELRAVNEELEAFAYAVSHDLRAPLRAIDGFSQIIVEDEAEALSQAGHENLARVRAAAQKMGELIDALLALSRLGRKQLDIGRIDLSWLAAEAVQRLREQDPGRSVEVAIAPGCKVTTDAALIDVVLTNLLGNAWKFTKLRSEAHIEFGQAALDGERVFYVRDDGAGFDPAYTDKLFQPFQRLHAADQFPGTGIGLATVRRIVARLGGRVWAEAEVEKGATFYFTMPETAGEA